MKCPHCKTTMVASVTHPGVWSCGACGYSESRVDVALLDGRYAFRFDPPAALPTAAELRSEGDPAPDVVKVMPRTVAKKSGTCERCGDVCRQRFCATCAARRRQDAKNTRARLERSRQYWQGVAVAS